MPCLESKAVARATGNSYRPWYCNELGQCWLTPVNGFMRKAGCYLSALHSPSPTSVDLLCTTGQPQMWSLCPSFEVRAEPGPAPLQPPKVEVMLCHGIWQ